MKVTILATGGTFDKVYYDAQSDYQIGNPQAFRVLNPVTDSSGSRASLRKA